MFVSEIIKNFRKIYLISIIDFKSAFKSSVLSWFWVVINPLLTILMYLFSFAVNTPNDKDLMLVNIVTFNEINNIWSPELMPTTSGFNKIGWLLIGVLSWTFIGTALSAGSSSIRNYNWLITKVGSPLSTAPAAVCLSKAYIGIGSIIVSWFIYMIIASSTGDVIIFWNILQLPLLVILLFLFMLLWSIFISPLAGISRDIMNIIYILPIFLQWVTGIFLPLDASKYNTFLGYIFRINPLNFLIENIRGSIMSYSYFWCDWVSLVSFISFSIILFFLAWIVSKKSKKIVVDLI